MIYLKENELALYESNFGKKRMLILNSIENYGIDITHHLFKIGRLRLRMLAQEYDVDLPTHREIALMIADVHEEEIMEELKGYVSDDLNGEYDDFYDDEEDEDELASEEPEEDDEDSLSSDETDDDDKDEEGAIKGNSRHSGANHILGDNGSNDRTVASVRDIGSYANGILKQRVSIATNGDDDYDKKKRKKSSMLSNDSVMNTNGDPVDRLETDSEEPNIKTSSVQSSYFKSTYDKVVRLQNENLAKQRDLMKQDNVDRDMSKKLFDEYSAFDKIRLDLIEKLGVEPDSLTQPSPTGIQPTKNDKVFDTKGSEASVSAITSIINHYSSKEELSSEEQEKIAKYKDKLSFEEFKINLSKSIKSVTDESSSGTTGQPETDSDSENDSDSESKSDVRVAHVSSEPTSTATSTTSSNS